MTQPRTATEGGAVKRGVRATVKITADMRGLFTHRERDHLSAALKATARRLGWTIQPGPRRIEVKTP